MATSKVLAGRIAVITGGGSGIGRATSQLFAKHGASVAVVDRTQGGADETIASLPSHTDEQIHKSFVADVGDGDAVRGLVAGVMDTYKKPATILVNSAGITRDQLMLKMSEEDFDEVIKVNLKGTFLMCQAVSQAMVKSKVTGGSFINISSIIATMGNIGQANYSASKAGILGMTMTMAKELSRFDIRCNSVLPGFISTPMTDRVPEKVIKMMLSLIPLGTLGQPEDIAETCLFLASPASKYITGASIDVNGGMMG
ncbi:estradiol 17-beta-dehydrogenase 8 [Strongylocentrotus purpuratus]|uniref:(3R)-3-hydroxyacyl-CoA dehydrogenase n=1 Tax=Strongylocentrotus purpuratus TaxID=7668 RepID=A0A7M7PLZ7_STRPU|nr:estradiol 17-beta-dehydrogenase 8 [Strongylocentrotus purpuratus]